MLLFDQDMVVNVSAYKALYLKAARQLVGEYIGIISLPDTKNTTEDLLRIFHSLKGQSLAMGYKNMSELFLLAETLCQEVRDNLIHLSIPLKDYLPLPVVLYASLDAIEQTNVESLLVNEIAKIQKVVDENKPKKLNVLLAEDDMFFQEICSKKLREKSITFDVVNNGEDAVMRIAGKKYDCILLDIIMPKKNGFEVLAYARENNIIPQTPIIVLTTLGQEDSVQRALSMGAANYINKGKFNFDLLVSEIESVINRNKM